jgi:hypothetical protein
MNLQSEVKTLSIIRNDMASSIVDDEIVLIISETINNCKIDEYSAIQYLKTLK